MPMNTEIHHLTWADVDAAVARLAGLVMPGRSGIYGVPRGGLVLAVALSHFINLPLLTTAPDPKALIVDDIADSGKTLAAFPNHQCLAMVRRWGAHCRAQAAINLPEGDRRWVLFPWELNSNVIRDKAKYASSL